MVKTLPRTFIDSCIQRVRAHVAREVKQEQSLFLLLAGGACALSPTNGLQSLQTSYEHQGPAAVSRKKCKTSSVYVFDRYSPSEYMPMQILSSSKRMRHDAGRSLIFGMRPESELADLMNQAEDVKGADTVDLTSPSSVQPIRFIPPKASLFKAKSGHGKKERAADGSSLAMVDEARPKTPSPSKRGRSIGDFKVLVLDPYAGTYNPPIPVCSTPSTNETGVVLNPYRKAVPMADVSNQFKPPRFASTKAQRARAFDWMDEDQSPPAPTKPLTRSVEGPEARAMMAHHEREATESAEERPDVSVEQWFDTVDASIESICAETKHMVLQHQLVVVQTDIDKLVDAMRATGVEVPTAVGEEEESVEEEYEPYCMKRRYPDVLKVSTRAAIVQCLEAQQALASFVGSRVEFEEGRISEAVFLERIDEVPAFMLCRTPGHKRSDQVSVEWRADRITHALDMHAMEMAKGMAAAVRDTPVIMSRGVCMELKTKWATESDAQLYEYYAPKYDYCRLKQLYLQRCAERQTVEICLIQLALAKADAGAVQSSPSPPVPVSPSMALPSQASGSQVEQAIMDAMSSAAKTPKRTKEDETVLSLKNILASFDNIGESQDVFELKEALTGVTKDLDDIKEAFKKCGLTQAEIDCLGTETEPLDGEFIPCQHVKCDYATLKRQTKISLDNARAANAVYSNYMLHYTLFKAGMMDEKAFVEEVEKTLLASSAEPYMFDRITEIHARAEVVKDTVHNDKVYKESCFTRLIKQRPTVTIRGYNMTWEFFQRVQSGMIALRENTYVSYTYQDLKLEFLWKSAEAQAIQILLVEAEAK